MIHMKIFRWRTKSRGDFLTLLRCTTQTITDRKNLFCIKTTRNLPYTYIANLYFFFFCLFMMEICLWAMKWPEKKNYFHEECSKHFARTKDGNSKLNLEFVNCATHLYLNLLFKKILLQSRKHRHSLLKFT